jgi:hypothetical protein
MKGGLVWIAVGVLLLIGMFVGVKFLFPDSTATADGTNKDGGDPQQIVAFGMFDVEKGVAMLYPRQFGLVDYVHAESLKAKEGEWVKVKKDEELLRVEDGMAQAKVMEAEAAVKASEQQLEEAKTLPKLYKLQKEQQDSAVKAAELEIEKFKTEIDSKLNGVEGQNPTLAELYRKLAKFGDGQLKEKKKSEEAKLKQIDLQNPDLKIKQAEADLQSKQAQLKQAKEALSHFKILAPSDGYVLRVHARLGETLGPNPRSAAIEFVPDAPIIVRAEVLQEWGRHVKPGAAVVIEDDTYKGPEWKGVVAKVSNWYAPIRSPVIEPFRYNDVRTLECIIEVTGGDSPKLIGQRVRARIKIEK